MGFSLQSIDLKAYIVPNENETDFTIYSSSVGGPIITAPTVEGAEQEFKNALKLACTIKNFLYFQGANRALSDPQRKLLIAGFEERVGKVEFIRHHV